MICWINKIVTNLQYALRNQKHFLKLGFTPYKAGQPLRAMELQEKKAKKYYSTPEICLERTYS